MLTPRGRMQLITGARRFPRFEYENDPDLQPVRSFELGILVRATQELSEYINNRVGVLRGVIFIAFFSFSVLIRSSCSSLPVCAKLVDARDSGANGPAACFSLRPQTSS